MPTYYVGPGGNDANDGLSWVNRKLTLNGCEDVPITAGSTVYVGPGVYRELLTVDVSGSSGSPITYIGDVTGEHTDGVGGVVRVTGSDNDTTAARASCIEANSKDYRTFQGFALSHNSGAASFSALNNVGANCIVQDCAFSEVTIGCIRLISGAVNTIVRRCSFAPGNGIAVQQSHSSAVDDRGTLIEDCVSVGGSNVYYFFRVGGVTVKNCTIIGGVRGVYSEINPNAGQTIGVYNSIFYGCTTNSIASAGAGFVVEDYNTIVGAARSNVSTGANSNTYPPLFALPILHAGQVLPVPPLGTLSEWSQVKRIAGTSEASDDLFGRTRPATSSKKSWGAVQYNGIARETTTIDGGSGASLKLDDAGRVAWRVPVTAVSTTISVKVYREADYAGTAPQMVIKQPGQADRTTTDAGSAATWNTLTDTFTPAASPPYVVVEVVSSNTATSGNYDSFVDTLSVS